MLELHTRYDLKKSQYILAEKIWVLKLYLLFPQLTAAAGTDRLYSSRGRVI